jgi:hypothetical protein
MRRFVPLAIALTALAVIPVQSANAAAANTCDGQKTQITGSGKSEKFTLTKSKLVINAHGGNDVIEGPGITGPNFLDFAATVCMGSGNDILKPIGRFTADDGTIWSGPDAVPVRYLDGGSGFDTATIYICFEGNAGPKWTIRNVERITVVNCQD